MKIFKVDRVAHGIQRGVGVLQQVAPGSIREFIDIDLVERSSGKRDEFEVWLYFKHWLSDSYEYSDRKHRIFHGSGGYLWKI